MARTEADHGKPGKPGSHNVDLSGPVPPPAVRRGCAVTWRSRKATGPSRPVLMIHEAFGLDGITVRHADRLAAAGYLTLAVDLFSDGGARRCLVATMRALAAGEGRAFTDLATAREWLLESGRTTGKIGVIGFCMGGGFALLLANDGFDAAAVNYGRLPKDPEKALAGACPIVANFGGKDRCLPGGRHG